MEHTKKEIEEKESSAIWASDKGSCTEAPHGATGQNPAEQKAGETPLTGGSTCLWLNVLRRAWRAWQRKSALSVSELLKDITVVLPKSGPGRLSSQRLLLGTLATVDLGSLWAIRFWTHSSLVHLGLSM
jgi:hypothetical protein